MTTKDDSGPAFPINVKERNGQHYATKLGMSLRDYFAGQAMVGFGAAGTTLDCDEVARRCYVLADAMLKARQG